MLATGGTEAAGVVGRFNLAPNKASNIDVVSWLSGVAAGTGAAAGAGVPVGAGVPADPVKSTAAFFLSASSTGIGRAPHSFWMMAASSSARAMLASV